MEKPPALRRPIPKAKSRHSFLIVRKNGARITGTYRNLPGSLEFFCGSSAAHPPLGAKLPPSNHSRPQKKLKAVVNS
jgi:hypothetical protein